MQETLRIGIDLETRVHWQIVLAGQLTRDWLFVEDEDEPDEEPEDEDVPEEDPDDEDVPEEDPDDEDVPEEDPEDEADLAPTARIETDPETAAEIVLELDQTVVLDASGSDAGSAAIESYKWDLGGDGDFDTTGEVIDVTVAVCGEFPVVLCVTNEDGLSDESNIVLSTA